MTPHLRSFQSPEFTCGWEKQLVVAIINKHWQEALGGAGGYANPTVKLKLDEKHQIAIFKTPT